MGVSALEFMPYTVRENYRKRVEEILSFTKEEEEAIDTYQGNSIMLNEILGNYISDQAILVPGMQYYTTKFSGNRETVERLMQEAQDLYSAMAKKSYGRKRRFRLYRGASKNLMQQKDQSFISTTTSQMEAVNWATSNNRKALEHYLIELNVEEGVTLLYMPDKGVEDEVLISPFVEVDEVSETYGQANGTPIKRQVVKVRKKELKELSPEEIERLQEEILVDADNMSELTTECIKKQREIEELRLAITDYRTKMNWRYQSFNDNKISYADYREFEKAYAQEKEENERLLDEKLQELKSMRTSLDEWKMKIRKVVEARCKLVEIGLQRQVEQALDEAREETNQIARERYREEQEAAQKEKWNATRIRSKIESVKALLLNLESDTGNGNPLQNAIIWRKKLKDLQIPYNSPTERCLASISRINYDCESAHDGVLQRASQIEELPKMLRALQGTENSLERTEINEFERALEALVVELRIRQEERILVNDRKGNETQKIGLVGKLIGKEKKQQEAIGRIDMQLQRLREFGNVIQSNGLNPDFTYSVHDILAEIQVAQSKGMLTDAELAQLENYKRIIMNNFQIRQDRIAKMYYNKTQGKIENYDTIGFINQYSTRVAQHSMMNIGITMAERLCANIGNQIAQDERWQRQREKSNIENPVDRNF